jgi:hypothetical protein
MTEPKSEPETQPSRLQYTLHRVRRHAYWARTEGIKRLIEEDRLDPRQRIKIARAKRSWRRRHAVPAGSAVPVYVVGLQRSGTNMLMRGLDEAPEVEVRNENDNTVFYRFHLREDSVLLGTIGRSRQRLVLVKPLCESYRVDELLALPGVQPGKAVWVFRDVDDRARSEVSKFGDSNLQALRRIAAGEGEQIWQGRRLTPEAVELVRSFDVEAMSPDTAAALFWVLRNQLYFQLGLDQREDVLLVSYDELVKDPQQQLRRLCTFLDFPYRGALDAHIERRSSHRHRTLEIDPRVRALAETMAGQLRDALVRTGGTA